jgi:hypothetical protein
MILFYPEAVSDSQLQGGLDPIPAIQTGFPASQLCRSFIRNPTRCRR